MAAIINFYYRRAAAFSSPRNWSAAFLQIQEVLVIARDIVCLSLNLLSQSNSL